MLYTLGTMTTEGLHFFFLSQTIFDGPPSAQRHVHVEIQLTAKRRQITRRRWFIKRASDRAHRLDRKPGRKDNRNSPANID